eukprot:1658509-Alexandrium_andersonii.AAC.1
MPAKPPDTGRNPQAELRFTLGSIGFEPSPHTCAHTDTGTRRRHRHTTTLTQTQTETQTETHRHRHGHRHRHRHKHSRHSDRLKNTCASAPLELSR